MKTAQDIPNDIIEKVKKETEDKIKELAAGWNWSGFFTYEEESGTIEKSTCIGNYFISKKATSNSNTKNNMLFMIYKIDADIYHKDADEHTKFSFYYCSAVSNIQILTDGTCSVDLSNIEYANDSFYSPVYDTGKISFHTPITVFHTIYGYEDLDSIFNTYIAKNISDYDYEVNINEEAAQIDTPAETTADETTEATTDESVESTENTEGAETVENTDTAETEITN